MKKIFLLVLTTLFVGACQQQKPQEQVFTQEGDVEVGPYTVSVIEPGIYHLQDYIASYPAGEVKDDSGKVVAYNNPSDMYLLVGEEKALLIDLSNEIKWADNAAESLQKIVADRIGGKPLLITCTHNHGDHLGMLPAFSADPAVRFLMPKVDFESLTDRFPENQLTLYDEGFRFDLGGMKVNTLMVQGHTPGSMVFFVEGKDLCFTGDAVGSGSGVWLFTLEAFNQYGEGVRKLMEYITDPANGIDRQKLVLWGGHYHQRSGLKQDDGRGMGYDYLAETSELIGQIKEGTAAKTPVSHNKLLDVHFTYKNAGIVWNDSLSNIVRLR
ncbi:MAG: MBL fold metallo-hydrolase [Bacteroidaceae bacterium]|nr:MBL fold metallo-hydrolase [Bacteroidaceae bacterium]